MSSIRHYPAPLLDKLLHNVHSNLSISCCPLPVLAPVMLSGWLSEYAPSMDWDQRKIKIQKGNSTWKTDLLWCMAASRRYKAIGVEHCSPIITSYQRLLRLSCTHRRGELGGSLYTRWWCKAWDKITLSQVIKTIEKGSVQDKACCLFQQIVHCVINGGKCLHHAPRTWSSGEKCWH